MLAVGNQNGKVYLWDIDVDDPSQARLFGLFILIFNISLYLWLCRDAPVKTHVIDYISHVTILSSFFCKPCSAELLRHIWMLRMLDISCHW